ncbi:hypothetical protein EJB05_51199, partial [Eragrostis curvula]
MEQNKGTVISMVWVGLQEGGRTEPPIFFVIVDAEGYPMMRLAVAMMGHAMPGADPEQEEPKEVIFFGPNVADLERRGECNIRRDGHPKRRGKKKNKRFTQWRRRGGWRDWIRKEQAMDGRFDPYEEAEKHAAALAAGLVDPDADEIEELKEQVLAQLRAGQYVVRRGGRYVCPFCNLAIREWSFKCALQHARDIGKSPAAEWEMKAKHRALTVFLSQDAQFAVDRANDGMGGV